MCGPCSSNKRFLAKNATEKLRVCDLCDTKMDNIKLRNQFDKFLQLKKEKQDKDSGVNEDGIINGQGYVVTDRNSLLEKLKGLDKDK